jgi:hypothetical protein
MKEKIRLEVMKVYNQEENVDTVVSNILLLFGDLVKSKQLSEHKCKPMVNAEWTLLNC